MARVLVVDDEPGVRTAVARGLTAEGMDVVAVGDGQSALRAALTGSFDAVVLDIILPGLSGYRVLERLRAAGVDTPVLLLSAKDGEVDQADGLDLGADGYLVKPFSFVVLVAQLRAMLRRRDGVRAGRRIALGSLVVDPVARSVTLDRALGGAVAAGVRAAARAGQPPRHGRHARTSCCGWCGATSRPRAATSSRSTWATCGASSTPWVRATSCAPSAGTATWSRPGEESCGRRGTGGPGARCGCGSR